MKKGETLQLEATVSFSAFFCVSNS